jgi:hypothetical protein
VRAYGLARLSPDDTQIALIITGQDVNIWIWDFARETLRRVTLDADSAGRSSTRNVGPVWTPNGRRIVFSSDRAGVLNIFSLAADGSGTVDRITTNPNRQFVSAVTPDGTHAIGWQIVPTAREEIVAYSLADPSKAAPVVQTKFSAVSPELSPAGRISPISRMNRAKRKSTCARIRRWTAAAGRLRPVVERASRGRTMDVSCSTTMDRITSPPYPFSPPDGGSSSAAPRNCSTPHRTTHRTPRARMRFSLDGQRFLFLKNVAASPTSTTPSMIVVQHWPEEVKAHMPGK